jgi:hypothetical protein
MPCPCRGLPSGPLASPRSRTPHGDTDGRTGAPDHGVPRVHAAVGQGRQASEQTGTGTCAPTDARRHGRRRTGRGGSPAHSLSHRPRQIESCPLLLVVAFFQLRCSRRPVASLPIITAPPPHAILLRGHTHSAPTPFLHSLPPPLPPSLSLTHSHPCLPPAVIYPLARPCQRSARRVSCHRPVVSSTLLPGRAGGWWLI